MASRRYPYADVPQEGNDTMAAEFGAEAVALLVAGGGLALVTAAVFGVRWVGTLPHLPPADTATPELPGPEPPAIANLLVNRCKVTTAAAAATLLDLAARRWLLLFQLEPGRYVVRVQRPRDEPLTEYETQVLDLVRAKATGGSAPLEAIELDSDGAEAWRKRFAAKVLDDARHRGLIQRRWSRRDGLTVASLAAMSLVLLAAGLYVAGVESSGPQNEDSFSRDDWFVVAGALWLVVVLGFVALRSVTYSPTGMTAAGRWLGLKRFLHAQDGFDDAPAGAIAIWDRLLSYGAAIGAARGALDGIALEVEDLDVAWSRYDGHWRQLRVDYPTRFGYGQPPLRVLGGGLVRVAFWGAIAFAVLPTVLDVLWSFAHDALDTDTADAGNVGTWLVVAFTAVFGSIGACVVARLVDGLVRTSRALGDLRARRHVTGLVVKQHRAEGVTWVAIDPGEVDEVDAYRWITPSALPARGDVVTVELTPHLRHVLAVEVAPTSGGQQ